jgi:hypothetical protein
MQTGERAQDVPVVEPHQDRCVKYAAGCSSDDSLKYDKLPHLRSIGGSDAAYHYIG